MLRRWLPTIALGFLILVMLSWALARNPAHEERDIVQERLDEASAPLTSERTIGQTFISRHAGLKAVEVLLAIYEQPDRQVPASATISLTLQRTDKPKAVPLTVKLCAAGLKHNQHLRFSFPPLPDSAQGTYRITLSSDGDYGLGVWRTASDAYAGGEALDNAAPQPGDLYFITTYDYHLDEALGDALAACGRLGRYVPAFLILLFLPGFVFGLYTLPAVRLDAGVYFALTMALSLAIWPLVLLWSTAFGIALNGGRIWIVVVLFLLAGAFREYWWRVRRGGKEALPRSSALPSATRDSLPDIVLVLVVLATLVTRLLQIRELVVPAWVDSVHHTLITQMISEQGVLPPSYQPYMPGGDFFYHYGFHANAAVLTWLSGLAPYQAVLLFGQILNTATVLSAYTLAVELTKKRWAGVGTAVVVGALSNMPAYYVSWGRYTQLAGLFLLPSVCLITIWLLETAKPRRELWIIGTVMIAGLAVTHYRVLVFYVAFWLSYLSLLVWKKLSASGPRGARIRWLWGEMVRFAGRALVLGGLTLVLITPWAQRLLLRVLPNVGTLYGGWEAPEGYNAFPWDLINSGWTRQLLYVAGAGAAWSLLRRQHRMLLLVLWVGLWFLIANPHLLGLYDIRLIHNSSVVIALWLPTSVLCGWIVADLAALTTRALRYSLKSIPWQRITPVVLAAITCFLVAWGSWHMVDIVNPVTILITPDDLQAIRWVRQNTPPDARILVNTRKWMEEERMGTDGGWWLPFLASRQVTMPSVLYANAPSYFRAVNDLARTVEEAKSVDDPALIARLTREGITHVFVGARGGRLMPKELDASPHYKLLYTYGPTRVYAFTP